MNWWATLDENDSFVLLVRGLGYEVTWDGKRSGESWYEVSDSGGMFVQIDMGVPLPAIRHDFIDLLAGRDPTSGADYAITGPDSEALDGFMRKMVAAIDLEVT